MTATAAVTDRFASTPRRVRLIELWDGRWWPGRMLHGLPAFEFRLAPSGLLTRRQLRDKNLSPGGQEPFARLVWNRDQCWAWLYIEQLARPKRTPSAAQLEAIEKALAARKVCANCGPVEHCVRTTDQLCGDCHAAGVTPTDAAGTRGWRVLHQWTTETNQLNDFSAAGELDGSRTTRNAEGDRDMNSTNSSRSNDRGPEVLDEFSPVEQTTIRNTVADRAADYFGGPLNFNRDDTARYLAEGALRDLTDRHSLRVVWEAVAAVIAQDPSVLTRSQAQRDRIRTERVALLDELNETAASAAQAGDFDGALRLLDEIEGVDPSYRPGPRSIDDLRQLLATARDKNAATQKQPIQTPVPQPQPQVVDRPVAEPPATPTPTKPTTLATPPGADAPPVIQGPASVPQQDSGEPRDEPDGASWQVTRILVTGSRDWTDSTAIADALAVWRVPGTVLVHGDAKGADRIAAAIWKSWGLPVEAHPADWKQHGKAAGYRRNEEMVEAGADVCVAFIRNNSRGATHCADTALAAGITTQRYRFNDAQDRPTDAGATTDLGAHEQEHADIADIAGVTDADLAENRVGLQHDYRNVHGYADADAPALATVEVMEGIDATRDLPTDHIDHIDRIEHIEHAELDEHLVEQREHDRHAATLVDTSLARATERFGLKNARRWVAAADRAAGAGHPIGPDQLKIVTDDLRDVTRGAYQRRILPDNEIEQLSGLSRTDAAQEPVNNHRAEASRDTNTTPELPPIAVPAAQPQPATAPVHPFEVHAEPTESATDFDEAGLREWERRLEMQTDFWLGARRTDANGAEEAGVTGRTRAGEFTRRNASDHPRGQANKQGVGDEASFRPSTGDDTHATAADNATEDEHETGDASDAHDASEATRSVTCAEESVARCKERSDHPDRSKRSVARARGASPERGDGNEWSHDNDDYYTRSHSAAHASNASNTPDDAAARRDDVAVPAADREAF